MNRRDLFKRAAAAGIVLAAAPLIPEGWKRKRTYLFLGWDLGYDEYQIVRIGEGPILSITDLVVNLPDGAYSYMNNIVTVEGRLMKPGDRIRIPNGRKAGKSYWSYQRAYALAQDPNNIVTVEEARTGRRWRLPKGVKVR